MYFDLLQDAQSRVCILAFVKKIEVSTQFWKFIKDFDRIDDNEWREYLFNKIKKHEYSLDAIPALDERFYSK